MNKTTLITSVILMAVMASFSVSAETLSLRGDLELTDASIQPEKRKQRIVEGAIARSYEIQPPSIPHKIDKEQINIKTNTCMKCHSEATYEKEKAPRIGDSHYVDRNGNTLDALSSRRYFCNQCHTLQIDAPELVENTFIGAQ